jgi:hypothetical protein
MKSPNNEKLTAVGGLPSAVCYQEEIPSMNRQTIIIGVVVAICCW